MRFKEIISRLTGFSVPIFGVSWNPPEPEIKTAQRVIAFLEDRRVLFNPYEMEMPEHCIESIIEIRHYLTQEIGALDSGTDLAATLRAMRASCRKFLDAAHIDVLASRRSYFSNWTFNSGLGELRGVFGIHLAKLAAQHGLDIEDNLATILPALPEDSDDESTGKTTTRRKKR